MDNLNSKDLPLGRSFAAKDHTGIRMGIDAVGQPNGVVRGQMADSLSGHVCSVSHCASLVKCLVERASKLVCQPVVDRP